MTVNEWECSISLTCADGDEQGFTHLEIVPAEIVVPPFHKFKGAQANYRGVSIIFLTAAVAL